MQPSPYDRTMNVVRGMLRRQPIASTALLLACAWIGLNIYEMAAHWRAHSFGVGWFQAVAATVTLSAIGILAVAALAWLVERVFRDTRP
jgi:hypothetical protein